METFEELLSKGTSLADRIHAERKMTNRVCWSLIKQWFRREAPSTLIAPPDFQKISIGGVDHFFDSAEMGWRFYYQAAKTQNSQISYPS